jgi:hypothetical protein
LTRLLAVLTGLTRLVRVLRVVTRRWRRRAHDDPFYDMVMSGCRLVLRRLSRGKGIP